MQPRRQQDLHLGRNLDGLIHKQKSARRAAALVVVIALALASWLGYMSLKNPEAPFVTKWLLIDSALVIVLLWFALVGRKFWAALMLFVFAGLFAWLVSDSGAAFTDGIVSHYLQQQFEQLMNGIKPADVAE